MTHAPAARDVARITVAVDAAPLLGTRTGMGVVVAGLLAALEGRADIDVRGFGLTATGWRALRDQLPAHVGAGRAPMPAGALLRLWAAVPQPPVEWWTGPVDVVHGTNFVVPPARRAARVVTVADLTPLRYPEMATPTSQRYPALVARAVARGAVVHTFARSVAAEVVEAFGADPEQVRVVAPGVDRPPVPPAGGAGQPGPPYVLALGTVEPRKDLPGLVAAFDAVAGDHPDLELRIAGPDGWGSDALAAATAQAHHRARIHRLGWVPDPAALLAGATVLAYPSLYEGFGLPPLEAMAYGVPVVTTDAGALPEVVGDAAAMVPAGDVDALAAAIGRVVSDGAYRTRLVGAGTARVGLFTWEAAGEGFAALYRNAAATAGAGGARSRRPR
jgi:glycosyltransferase involved in cell wall biosynthesis